MSAPASIDQACPLCALMWCTHCHPEADARPDFSSYRSNDFQAPEWQRYTQLPGEPFQSMDCSIQATPQHHPYSMEAARAHGSCGQRSGSQGNSHSAVRAAECTSSQYDPAPYPASPAHRFPQSRPWSDSQSAACTPNYISPTQSIQSTLSPPSLTPNTPSDSQDNYTSLPRVHLTKSLRCPGPSLHTIVVVATNEHILVDPDQEVMLKVNTKRTNDLYVRIVEKHFPTDNPGIVIRNVGVLPVVRVRVQLEPREA
ncbi:hypothetical protein BT96DRAFT_933874 [Gymnopus androsaceus JB14]|uniref:Uncharacterized protein n=1 Tax=Gymnopus androsaceus JB14 TaxID=1447944 RepID=A0A6A4I9J8_9AGAR|nr:hypothetical protein BT96DRAFT_933874 [Gymnopus androsaceus JB14]